MWAVLSEELNNMQVIQIIGTAAFVISGYLVGYKKRLDVLGVVIVSLLTAIGGGMTRDALISRVPLIFRDNLTLTVIFVTLLIAVFLRLQKRDDAQGDIFVIADAIGLAAFSIVGSQVGVNLGLNFFGVLTLGFVSAVGGGIIRDILVNEVPFVLSRDLYGTVAIVMAAAVYFLNLLGWDNPVTLHLLLVLGVAIRLLAHYRKLELPGFKYTDNEFRDLS